MIRPSHGTLRKGITLLALVAWLQEVSVGQIFIDVSEAAGITYHGADSVRLMSGIAVVDYDNDGDDDVFATSPERGLAAFRNDGIYNFVEVTDDLDLGNLGFHPCAITSADLDNDGWQDLILTTVEDEPLLLLKNNEGTYGRIRGIAAIDNQLSWGAALTLADINNDGFLDIYVGNYAEGRVYQVVENAPEANHFFLSQGTAWTYEEQAQTLDVAGLGYTFAARFLDLDRDGDQDLYVANDFGTSGFEGNRYYEAQDGTFIERGADYGLDISMFAMGIGYGDVDNDQDFDLYLSDLGPNRLLENIDGTFTDIATSTFAIGDYTSWGGEFLDANNDGLLDIMMTNGNVLMGPDEPILFYENLGGTFLNYQYSMVEQPLFPRGVAFSDLDNDGDLDCLVTTVIERDTITPNLILILENRSESQYLDHHYLQVQVQDPDGPRDGIGSVLTVHLEDGTTLSRSIDIGGAYLSGHTHTVHFGLGARRIEKLEISWPDGTTESYREIPTNSLVYLTKRAPMEVLRSELTLYTPHSNTDHNAYQIFSNNGILHVLSDELLRAELTLYDLSGRKRSHQHIQLPAAITITGLSGMHIAELRSQDHHHIQKVLLR